MNIEDAFALLNNAAHLNLLKNKDGLDKSKWIACMKSDDNKKSKLGRKMLKLIEAVDTMHKHHKENRIKKNDTYREVYKRIMEVIGPLS